MGSKPGTPSTSEALQDNKTPLPPGISLPPTTVVSVNTSVASSSQVLYSIYDEAYYINEQI